MDLYNSDDQPLSAQSHHSSFSQQYSDHDENHSNNHSLEEIYTTEQVFEFTQENITCQICYKYAINAVICQNDKCQKLLCLACASNIKKTLQDKCPFCRSNPFQFYTSPYSEVINNMQLICTLCKEKYVLSTEQKHYKEVCSYFHKIQCNYCHQKFKKQELIKHTKLQHFDKIDEIIESFYLNPPPQYDSTCILNKNKQYLQKIGKKPRLGTNGKFYCGGKLQTKCTCCNGFCGPTNGQNCSQCMKLDLKRFGAPKGSLVNSSGHVCFKKGDEFACGVMFNLQKQSCIQGNVCRACKNMKKNIKRYQKLI